MRLLLDTCVFFRAMDEVENLSTAARLVIQDPANEIVFHQIPVLEIHIKHSLGKLAIKAPPAEFLPKAESSLGTVRHTLDDAALSLLGKLPWVHRDPARILW